MTTQPNPIQVIPFEQIHVDAAKNGRKYDPVRIKSLAASIAKRGLLQPVVVREADYGTQNGHNVQFFNLVAGFRRMAALAQLRENGNPVDVLARIMPAIMPEGPADEDDAAGDPDVPSGVTPANVTSLLDNLAENHEHEPMTLIDYADTIIRLTATGMTKKEIAKELHKSDGWVSVVSHFPELRPWIQERIRAGTLAFKLARELRGKTDAEQDKLISQADAGGATKAVASRSKRKKNGKPAINVKRVVSDVDKYLTEISQREKVTAKEERAVTAQRHMLKCLAGKMSPSQLHARVMELV